MQKALLGGIAMLVLVVVGVAVYFLRLTAPVAVSQPPVVITAVTTVTAAADSVPSASSVGPSGALNTATTGGTATGAGGTTVYRIDPAQSQAAYHAKETFINRNNLLNAPVGVTKAITGEVSINRSQPAGSKVGPIVIDISQLKSDSDRRDNAIRRQWLESSRYPLATFANATLSAVPGNLQEGTPFQFNMSGDLTLHGVTKPVTWAVNATLQGTILRGQATTPLKMSTFNVKAPDIAGLLKAEDDVTITLDFVAVATGAVAP